MNNTKLWATMTASDMKKETRAFHTFSLVALLLLSTCGGPARKESRDYTGRKEIKTDFYTIIPYDQSNYAELIALYNGGHFSEFYKGLDSIRTQYRFLGESEFDGSPALLDPLFSIEILEDSVLVRQLVFDADMKLIAVGINQMSTKGTYTIQYNYGKLFDEIGSGVYYFLTRIGLDEELSRIIVLK